MRDGDEEEKNHGFKLGSKKLAGSAVEAGKHLPGRRGTDFGEFSIQSIRDAQ